MSCRCHSENRAKARLAAHHVFVGFRRPLQQEHLGHCPGPGEHVEGKSILRIDGTAGGPSHDRTPPQEQRNAVRANGQGVRTATLSSPGRAGTIVILPSPYACRRCLAGRTVAPEL